MPSRHRYAVPLLCATVALTAACGGGGEQPTAATTSSPAPSPSSAPTTSATTTPSSTTARRSSTTTASRTTAPKPAAKPRPKPTPRVVTSLPPVPRAGAEPAVRFPRNEAAVGAGANAGVTPVPDALWNRMVGYSWTSGCPVGRSQLRYVRVNFWGFDGKRSRGGIVVNRSIAAQTAAAFTRLYDLQFRIRQMRPMDSTWGKNPKGPGANDYAAMQADNTSAFNCRYVGGEEAKKVYSKHAYGTAVDVNDFENPYVAADGTVYPSSYWLRRRGPAPGVFSSGSAAVRAFTSQGFLWGARWAQPDYQHFDR